MIGDGRWINEALEVGMKSVLLQIPYECACDRLAYKNFTNYEYFELG